MIFYHRTAFAAAILKRGFRNRSGYYLTSKRWRGVWLSDGPLDANEGSKGDDVLWVAIPIDQVRQDQWVEDGKPYREFLVPASLVNRHGPPRLVSPDQAARIQRRRHRSLMRAIDDAGGVDASVTLRAKQLAQP